MEASSWLLRQRHTRSSGHPVLLPGEERERRKEAGSEGRHIPRAQLHDKCQELGPAFGQDHDRTASDSPAKSCDNNYDSFLFSSLPNHNLAFSASAFLLCVSAIHSCSATLTAHPHTLSHTLFLFLRTHLYTSWERRPVSLTRKTVCHEHTSFPAAAGQ